MESKIRSTKSETRNKKGKLKILISKHLKTREKLSLEGFGFWELRFWNCFVFRYSDFGFFPRSFWISGFLIWVFWFVWDFELRNSDFNSGTSWRKKLSWIRSVERSFGKNLWVQSPANRELYGILWQSCWFCSLHVGSTHRQPLRNHDNSLWLRRPAWDLPWTK